MPAGLATISGQTALTYYGKVPWPGLGQKLDKPGTAAKPVQGAGVHETHRRTWPERRALGHDNQPI